jgi:hypothetical protein
MRTWVSNGFLGGISLLLGGALPGCLVAPAFCDAGSPSAASENPTIGLDQRIVRGASCIIVSA